MMSSNVLFCPEPKDIQSVFWRADSPAVPGAAPPARLVCCILQAQSHKITARDTKHTAE